METDNLTGNIRMPVKSISIETSTEILQKLFYNLFLKTSPYLQHNNHTKFCTKNPFAVGILHTALQTNLSLKTKI